MNPVRVATILAILLAIGAALVPGALAGGGHAEPEPTVVHSEDGAEVDPGLRSPDLLPGQSWSQTFTEPAQFDYHCHPHPWMLAGIQVEPSTGRAPINHTIEILEPVGQDFENWTFSPAVTKIEAGDSVTWVNKGTVTHVIQQTTAEHLEHIGTAGAAQDEEHSVAAVAAAPDHGTGFALGMPPQGWMWVGLALVGGVFLGRQMTTRKASTGSPATSTPTSVGAGLAPTPSVASATPAGPVLSSHARQREKRNRRR